MNSGELVLQPKAHSSMDASFHSSLVGTILDEKYEILSLLGRGGMGEVYRAQHLRLERPVAIKILRAQLLDGSQGDEPLKRFEREAKVTSRIDHPHAVAIFDYGLVGSQPYLVMNLVDGPTLKQRLTKQPPLNTTERLEVLEQIAAALSHAHSLGIVHRDLKPDNVVLELTSEGNIRAQVLDFGLAKLCTDSFSGSSITSDGDTLGTPLYMSPEQVQGLESTPRSDIYSLGILAFELLAGDVPFRAEQAMSVLFKHLHEPPPSLREVNPEFPDSPLVEDVFKKVLAKNPNERFASAVEFVAHVKSAMTGSVYQPPAQQHLANKRRWSALAVVALLLVGGASALTFEHELPKIERELIGEERAIATSILEKTAPTHTATTDNNDSFLASRAPIATRLDTARQLLDNKQPKIAHRILLSIVVEVPSHAEAHYLLAKTNLHLQNDVRAYLHLKRAAELAPNNKEYQAQYQKALEVKQQIVKDRATTPRRLYDRVRRRKSRF